MSATRNKRRTIDAAGLAALALLTGAAYLAVVEPALDAQRRLELEKSESVKAEQKADQAASELADAQRQLVTLERELDTMAVELRSRSAINKQIDRLTGIASDSGVKLTRIAPGEQWGNQWFTAVPIAMSGTGTFAAGGAFLERVRGDCPDVSVRGLKLAGQPLTAVRAPAETPRAENAKTENPNQDDAPVTTIEIEFVWYAAPEGTTAAVTTK